MTNVLTRELLESVADNGTVIVTVGNTGRRCARVQKVVLRNLAHSFPQSAAPDRTALTHAGTFWKT